MNLFKKIKILFLLDIKTKLLFIEAFYSLGLARIQKIKPFSKLALSLGEQDLETSLKMDVTNRKNLINISQAVQIMSRYTLWESRCFVKALAAKKMLEKRGIESTLYFGTARDDGGKLIAHAWLRSGSFYLCGAADMDKFTVVSKFAWQTGGCDD